MTILSRPRQANPRGSGSLGGRDSRASQRAGLVTLCCDKRPPLPAAPSCPYLSCLGSPEEVVSCPSCSLIPARLTHSLAGLTEYGKKACLPNP